MEAESDEEICKKKDLIGLHQNIIRNILNQKFGEVNAQGGLISDVQREVFSVRCNFIYYVWASCGLAVRE